MQKVEINPYVIQVDKLVGSLDKLSHTFLCGRENCTSVGNDVIHRVYDELREKVCKGCESKKGCRTRDMLPEVLDTIEDYGAEMNVEMKRKVQKKCSNSHEFLQTVLDGYRYEKNTLLWKQRMAENRRSCAVQLGTFGNMIRYSTKELDASIFKDEYLEKKLKSRLGKRGIKMLSVVFFVNSNGRYEIRVTVKTIKGQCVTTKEVGKVISECTGRTMVADKQEPAMVGSEYSTISYQEGAKYHTLQGVAKIGKGCEKISGDNFSLLELSGGKQGVILSDGMGAGQMAYNESVLVVEVLEDFLTAGFSKEIALQMVNTAMVMGREEVKFSTVDMMDFDLHTGECQIAKAGASITFIKRKESVEIIKSTSLPLGVVANLDVDETKVQLEDGDMVIMVTDGVMDALPVGEAEILMRMFIEGANLNNPKELAHHILGQVLECSGEIPMDDMTVVAVGIWSLEK